MWNNKNTIRSRVMVKLEEVIQKVQKAHDDELQVMQTKFEQDKMDLSEKHIQSILGKIL